MNFRYWIWLLALLFAGLLLLRVTPAFNRYAQSDISGGEEQVINISRPYYIIPREWIRWGGMNLINFWSHAPDPLFEANKISFFKFLDSDGTVVSAAVQGFHVNRIFENPEVREEIMAIRSSDGIYEFPLPRFEFVRLASESSFHFLAQEEGTIYFYYWDADRSTDGAIIMPAIITVTLPLEARNIMILYGENKNEWDAEVERLRNLGLSDEIYERMCGERYTQKGAIVEQLFGVACQ